MITIPKFILKILPQKFLNSSLYYNIYYKYTKEHLKALEDSKNRVLNIRRKIIGK
jgi:uncharacterized protein with GYD domain